MGLPIASGGYRGNWVIVNLLLYGIVLYARLSVVEFALLSTARFGLTADIPAIAWQMIDACMPTLSL